jgi:subtilisin family serine protease
MAVLVRSAGPAVEDKSKFSRNEIITAPIGNGLKKTTSLSRPKYAPDQVVFKLAISDEECGGPPGRVRQFIQNRKQKVFQRHNLKKIVPLFGNRIKGRLNYIQNAYLRPGVSPIEAVKKLKANPDIEWAEPKYIVQTCLPNDTYIDPNGNGVWSSGTWLQTYADLWGMEKIHADQAWRAGYRGAGIVVAVIDTGVDYNHEDIADNMWVNPGEIADDGIDNDENGYVDDVYGYDFETYGDGTRSPDPIDGRGHGTHCAGTIAAVMNNSLGVAGLAPEVKIMAVKGLSDSGPGYTTDLADCVVYASNNGADVLSNSWSGIGYSYLLQDVFRYAHSMGCVCVVAAGNNYGDVHEHYPANIDVVIAVSATDINDIPAVFSNSGSLIDVAAPGVDVLSLRAAGTDMYMDGSHIVPYGNPQAKYYRSDGTSMACPHVAGLAAAIMSAHPEYSNEQIRQAIRISADDFGDPGFDIYFGSGRINAGKAITVSTVCDSWIDPLAGTDKIFTPTDINGTAAGTGFQSYMIEYGSVKDGSMHTIISSLSPEPNGVLAAAWFPEFHQDDEMYDLVLTVTDANGLEYKFTRRVSVPFRKIITPRKKEILCGKIPVRIEGNATYPATEFSYDVTYKPQSSSTWSDSGVILANDGTIPVVEGLLATIDPAEASALPETGFYDLRLTVYFDGDSSYTQKTIYVDKSLTKGFPVNIDPWISKFAYLLFEGPTVADLDGDDRQDIILSGGKRYVLAYGGDGNSLSGWPFDSNDYSGTISDGAPVYPDPTFSEKMAVMVGGSALYNLNYLGQLKPGYPLGPDSTRNIVADLDDDGWDELVWVARGGILGVCDLSGVSWSGWPQSAGTIDSRPAVGDIDGDGRKDVVVLQSNGAKAYDLEGNLLDEWTAELAPGFIVLHPPVLGDIDQDGKNEIVAVVYQRDTVHIFQHGGGEQPGWPQTVDGRLYAAPTVCDLDKDGFLEVIAGCETAYKNSMVYVWDYQGNLLPGWPQEIYSESRHSHFGTGAAAVGNIDSDPEPEILVCANSYYLHAFNPDGSIVEDFPKYAGGLGITDGIRPALGDIDGDRLTEIVYIGKFRFDFGEQSWNEYTLFVWDTNSPYLSQYMEWPMIGHDPGHTCSYTPPVEWVIKLDRAAYSCLDNVDIQVADFDLQGQGTQGVTITTDEGDLETVTLTENPPDSGIFEGTIHTSSDSVNIEDEMLQVVHGETITATYEDVYDVNSNPATVYDTAVVDCTGPVISNVEVNDIIGIAATVRFNIDDPGCCPTVYYGLACDALTETVPAKCDQTSHSVEIIELEPNTTYFYVVEASDSFGNSSTADNDGSCYTFTTLEPLSFPDSNLQAAVEQTLGILNPTRIDMLELTSLNATYAGIVDITGLEWATNLTNLNLHGNQISDIIALSGLTNLTRLNLDHNKITNINAVSGLTNLFQLVLAHNQISDINAISGLRNIWWVLNVSNNQISNINPISELKDLRLLYASRNQISDISALSGFTNLQYSFLEGNPLNTAAYCTYLPLIEANNPGIIRLLYDPNPNPLTNDCSTNLDELRRFASHWLDAECDEQNNWCIGADLIHLGVVNFQNFAEFAQLWLTGL